MEIETSRFGRLQLSSDDVVRFPSGIPGLENCQQWVLLADPSDPDLVWLQSTDQDDIALPTVAPKRFVPNYRVRVDANELSILAIERWQDAQVLVILGKHDSTLAVNLKAPLVINVRERLGRQVVTADDWSYRHPVALNESLRRSA